tara:strand:+ start:3413 stop:3664 length:252 start_codon:yes stop_codon:yes gene_type:complete
MEKLKQLGFEIIVTPWKETLWQLKEDDFFLCYNEKTKRLDLSQVEDDYLMFKSVKIQNVSIEKLKTLISILKQDERQRTVQEG